MRVDGLRSVDQLVENRNDHHHRRNGFENRAPLLSKIL
jgi:hypothetical protein